MKSAAKNIQIASYDDLFKTDAERQTDAQERVQSLPLDHLVPFPNHPFKVLDDDKMLETVESIRERGVLVPILVRRHFSNRVWTPPSSCQSAGGKN